MKKEDFLVLIDPGHGNNTKGKQSPVWKDDQPPLFEWKWNRDLAMYLRILLAKMGIRYQTLVPEMYDVCLKTRCIRANIRYLQNRNTILISLHGNAFGVESVEGFEVFTSPGITESDEIAEHVLNEAAASKKFIMRLNSQEKLHKDKEARFKILTGTDCPAILVEAGFYTNKKECAFMQSLEGFNVISGIIAEGINKYINQKITQSNEGN